jgi:hypothetical protein
VPLSIPVPQDQLATFGSTMTIEELDVTFPGGKLRKLVLVGGALPLKGQAKWAGSSRVITTWFVGNGLEGSQQVLGPTLDPSKFAGKWNRTRMGRAPSIWVDEKGASHRIVDPMRLWEIFEDFRRAGPRLRVTWAVKGKEIPGAFGRNGPRQDRDVDISIVREGRLTKVDVDPEQHTDLNWAAEFQWVSEGGRLDRVAQVRKDEDVALITQSLQDSIENLDTFVRTAAIVSHNARIPKSATALSLGRLEAFANGPKLLVDSTLRKLRYNVGQFKRAGDLARKIQATPYALESSVLDFARNTMITANQMVDTFGQQPVELYTNKRKVADIMRAQRYFGQILDGTTAASKKASDLAQRMRRASSAGANRGAPQVQESATTRAGDLLAIHVCKTGDTPGRVSMKYYGNQDQAVALLRANKLPLHTPDFRAGQILIVPVLAGIAKAE